MNRVNVDHVEHIYIKKIQSPFFFPSVNSKYPFTKGLKKNFQASLLSYSTSAIVLYTVYGIVFLRYHLQAYEDSLVAFLLISHQGFWGSCTIIVHVCVSVYYIVLSVVLAQYTLTPLDCFCWVMFVQCIHLQQSKSRSSVLLFSFYCPSPRLFFSPPFLPIWCFSVQLEMC